MFIRDYKARNAVSYSEHISTFLSDANGVLTKNCSSDPSQCTHLRKTVGKAALWKYHWAKKKPHQGTGGLLLAN